MQLNAHNEDTDAGFLAGIILTLFTTLVLQDRMLIFADWQEHRVQLRLVFSRKTKN